MKIMRIITASYIAWLVMTMLILTPVIGMRQPEANEYKESFVSSISGEDIVIIKDLQTEKTRYEDKNGFVYSDMQEILKKEASELYEDPNLLKLDGILRDLLRGDANNVIPVIIVFTEQPAYEVSNGVMAIYEQKFEEIKAPAMEIYERRENKTVSVEDLRPDAAEREPLTEAEIAVLNEVKKRMENEILEMRKEIYGKSEPLAYQIQAPIVENLEDRGFEVRYRGVIYNCIAANVPVYELEVLIDDPSVAGIWYDQKMTSTLDISAQAIDTYWFWSGGYDGGIWDAAVVDTGIDGTHPALSVDYAGIFHSAAISDPSYNDNQFSSDDLQGHGSHCAGIVASTDATYKGIAYGLDKLINAKAGWRGTDGKGWMYWSDGMAAIDWALRTVSDEADVISFSYSGSPGSNGDTAFCHFMDAVVYSYSTPVAVSAGNDGPTGTTVGEPASAYNVIAVGAIDDQNTATRIDDVIASYSSRGPTGDGRIKPDIVAPGSSIMSCNYNWEGGNPDYVSKSGTSMAAPHIAGSVLLLMDYSWRSPRAFKAILLNTAEDKGTTGPDNVYGYGYVDLDRAELDKSDVRTGSLTASDEKFFKATNVYSGETATLVWDRHVTYNNANYPTYWLDLSDLDLYMYDESNGGWVDSSTSSISNIEQVESDAYRSSTILKISPFSLPTGMTSESYAIAIDGISQANPPTLSASLSAPSSVASGATFTASTTVMNTGTINGHNVQATLSLPFGFTLISGSNPQSLGTISPGSGSSKTATWTVRAPTVGSTTGYTLSTSVSSSSYGESYGASATRGITVSPSAAMDTAGLFRPSSRTWYFNYDNAGGSEYSFVWGDRPDIEVAGDWNGDGKNTAGLFRPSTQTWYLNYDNAGGSEYSFVWGDGTDIPVVGDWDNDGKDEVGLYRPSTGRWYFNYDNAGGSEYSFVWGDSTDIPVVGDWNDDGKDTAGLFRPSTRTWYFNYDNADGSEYSFVWGDSTDIPVVGDWNGNGKDTAGLFRPSTRTWYFNYDNAGGSEYSLVWGDSSDIPVVGDWNGNGKDTAGLFRPSTQRWYFNYDNAGGSEYSFVWGDSSDIPVVGDWNGDGKDTAGLFRPSTQRWYFNYDNAGGSEYSFVWGDSSDVPVVGDWNGDGKDTAGLYRPSTQRWYFNYDNTGGSEYSFVWGDSSDLLVVGDWNGDGKDTAGLFRPSTQRWYFNYDNAGGNEYSFVWGDCTDIPIAGNW